jgi:DNA-binding transcriptional regulator YiaG
MKEIDIIWTALLSHRENCIRRGVSGPDEEWLDICNAMSSIEEKLRIVPASVSEDSYYNGGNQEHYSNIDIKAWRIARGITQEQAASLLAISSRHYQRIEAGHSQVTPMVDRLLRFIQRQSV